MIEEAHTLAAQGIVWDLSDLYQGDDDPGLNDDLKELHERSISFATSYRDKLQKKNLTTHTLLSAIKEYESIHEMGMRPYLFSLLFYSSNTQDHRRKRLLQKVREKRDEISQMLAFFKVDILALPAHLLKRLAFHPDLSKYSHFLLHLMELKPYALTEPEERIITTRNLSGRGAFIALYDDLLGSLSFPLEIEGKRTHLTTAQILALFHIGNRSVRERAFQKFLQVLGRQGMVFKNILNALILSHRQDDAERGHPTSMHSTHLSNEMEGSIIETMTGAAEDHYALARRYFRLKARILGLKRLKLTDVFAPLRKAREGVGFSKARKILCGAMEDLHPLFYVFANEIFEKGWIDGEVREAKKAGAFCKCLAPSQHPYISLHFSGDIKGLMTLAHELGHGIHYRLAAQQTYLNFDPPPVLAETAATFTELIVSNYLMGQEELSIHRSTLIASQIEGILVTVFRQSVLTRFEQTIHNLRQDHLMSEKEICKLWWEENLRLYGEDVDMNPAYCWGWTYISHFFHCPFYCYSYIFGNLLSIILFQNYKDKGKDFLEQIVHLFSAGSSRRPLDMLEEIGLDPRQKGFWNEAFRYIGGLIDSLEMYEKTPRA
jgi:oligoendopeptidase F